jgi:acetyl esterase/lipase
VEAAVEAIPELSSRYAVLGHSQGGHAVLGAASLADENPGVTLVAAVALAPASQVLAQGAFTESIYTDTTRPDAERISAAVGDLGFTTLLGHAIDTVIPSFDLDAAYGENGTELQQLTESTCLTEIREALAESVPPVLLANNNLDSFFAEDIETDPAVTTYFESVEPGNRAMAVPLLIAQGLADTTVFASSTATLLTQLSAVSDTDVDPLLNTYEGIGHGAILLASFNDAAAFIATQFATQADSE